MVIHQDFFDFVLSHLNDDTYKLVLHYSNKELPFSLDFAVVQIEARRKAAKKLPSFLKNECFLFPSVLSEEQATNEYIASFHASLIGEGKKVFDLTMGLGIDAFSIAKNGSDVIAWDIDPIKANVAIHNAQILKINNIAIHTGNSIEVLKNNTNLKADCIFIDPARRKGNQRVFGFEDCSPDIISNYDLLLSKCNTLLIKASPMLDIKSIENEIPSISHIYAISFKGECKEILIEVNPNDSTSNISKTSVIINPDGEFQCFNYSENILPQYSLIDRTPLQGDYLYEPDSSIMKFFPWQEICFRYPNLRKADIDTHLFLSKTFYADFPGRIMKIEATGKWKDIAKGLEGKHINIICRNHPEKPETIKKKLKSLDGGSEFLYCCRIKTERQPYFFRCKPY